MVRCTRDASPVVFVDEDKEALGGGVNESAQALVCRGIPMSHLLQYCSHDNHICDSFMLQEVHLHMAQRRRPALRNEANAQDIKSAYNTELHVLDV